MPSPASRIISDMENDTCAIRDLATILVMASAGANEVNAREAEPALVRFGWLIRDYAERLEAKRSEASGLLHGLASPGKEPRQ
jgi:hypothetical protein